ncbi:MAG TPA: TolC family protein [Pirellulaceae bacterium]|nr:TolC family protein [Pirellulaceae bacterium]HMO91929.1 TolC family protein [Pirellulaceae bacterium]HMP68728.1 TolC family protein [Pirellulaceae bacterium]
MIRRSPLKLFVRCCRKLLTGFTVLGIVLATYAGCTPSPPAYLRDNGNLNFYLQQATQIEYPDLQNVPLDEVISQRAPITITDAAFDSFWDLTLEEAVSIALNNTKVIRGFGVPGLQGGRVAPGVDSIISNGANTPTLYRVAIRESEPGIIGLPGQLAPLGSILPNGALEANQGVEAALADFDAQLTSVFGIERQDVPRNVFDDPTNPLTQITPTVFVQDQVTWQTELSKRTAEGTQFLVRAVNSYTSNNIPAAVQPLRSVYQTALEAEVRHPILRGRGAFINRMPVVISRIQTDQEIANLEAIIQNKVTNIEIRYWDLQVAYRNLETAKSARDSALDTWRIVDQTLKAGKVALQDESEARAQYYEFRSQVEVAFAALLDAESDLRWLMGIASTDGRLIRPIDDPVKAWVAFDWCDTLDEALSYRPELRQERWEVRKKQLQVAYAKNGLLPNLNATGLYRWHGLGDQFANYGDNVPRFASAGSGALNELFGGDYQEYRIGLDFGMSVGYRRELANVRNSQLKLAEQIAILEDMELDVARELSQAMRALDLQYELIQTSFNRWVASATELEAREQRWQAGTEPITFTLDAQRRRAQGEQLYYQALAEYNKMIALIHRRKGTILAYNNVMMDEGPWADKAYHDASELARRRSASRHRLYGWTRPEVVSQGSHWPTTQDGCEGSDCSDGHGINEGFYETYPSQQHIFDRGPQTDGNMRGVRDVEPEPLPVPQTRRPSNQGAPIRNSGFSLLDGNHNEPQQSAHSLLNEQTHAPVRIASEPGSNNQVVSQIAESYQRYQQGTAQQVSYNSPIGR